ncbi:MAG: helix-turn-helix domain-containing protein [Armatimonadetes bacterium]|nr:helix-turn-helix domain-containing protein [Armatimonadota bacterium]
MESKAFYTIEEVVGVLSLCRTAIYQLINAGKLKAVKFGRCTRIAASELERFEAEANEAGGVELRGR